MPRDRLNLNVRAALIAAIASACPAIGYCVPAAQVDFAVGNVTALASNGQSRALGKGAQIEQGDTVNTNKGRAQLRFTDGAYVSLQPESQFRVDEYRFDGQTDGNEKGLFSLLKGGLRTITGLVGRRNKANYQISTSVATIGIRGTEYTIQFGKSITGTVAAGEIEVCNAGGCLSVSEGKSYYVQSQQVKPVLTTKRTDLPAPALTQPPTNFTQGDNTAAAAAQVTTGGATGAAGGGTGFQVIGTQIMDAVSGNSATSIATVSNVPVSFDAASNIVKFNGIVPTSVQMGGNDAGVAWGTFTDAGALTHFVAGIPASTTYLSGLGNTSLTYNLLGSTPVTDSAGLAIGTLDSASLTLHLTPGAGTNASRADMNWTIQGSPLSASLSGSLTLPYFSISGACGTGCTVAAVGALFGPIANRAGMVYSIQGPSLPLDALGAAMFAK